MGFATFGNNSNKNQDNNKPPTPPVPPVPPTPPVPEEKSDEDGNPPVPTGKRFIHKAVVACTWKGAYVAAGETIITDSEKAPPHFEFAGEDRGTEA
jgi:hypothetical protein